MRVYQDITLLFLRYGADPHESALHQLVWWKETSGAVFPYPAVERIQDAIEVEMKYVASGEKMADVSRLKSHYHQIVSLLHLLYSRSSSGDRIAERENKSSMSLSRRQIDPGRLPFWKTCVIERKKCRKSESETAGGIADSGFDLVRKRVRY